MAPDTDFEIALFRAVIENRPVGTCKHFAMMGIQRMLKEELGREMSADSIWNTLAEFYNLQELDAMYNELSSDEMASSTSSKSTVIQDPYFTLDNLIEQDEDMAERVYQQRFEKGAKAELESPALPGDAGSPLTEPEEGQDSAVEGKDEEDQDNASAANESELSEDPVEPSASEEEEQEEEEEPQKRSRKASTTTKKAANLKGGNKRVNTRASVEPPNKKQRKK